MIIDRWVPISDPFVHAGDTPETVKMRLKQWAQVVALSMLSRHWTQGRPCRRRYLALGGEKSPEMQKKGIPAASGTKKRGEKIFCYLGFGGPPPSTLAYPISDRLLINFLSPWWWLFRSCLRQKHMPNYFGYLPSKKLLWLLIILLPLIHSSFSSVYVHNFFQVAH